MDIAFNCDVLQGDSRKRTDAQVLFDYNAFELDCYLVCHGSGTVDNGAW